MPTIARSGDKLLQYYGDTCERRWSMSKEPVLSSSRVKAS